MRANLISLTMLVLSFAIQLSAQKANPFELLWRKDMMGIVANVKPTVVPDSAPVAFIPPAVTPEITPLIVDTIAELIDTPLRSVEIGEIDTVIQTDTVVSEEPSTAEVVDTAALDDVPVVSSPQDTSENTPLALVLLFGLIFTLLAWGLSLNRELLKKIYRAAMNENLSSLLYREQRFATTQYLYYTIYIIFFLNGGMFLYFLSRQFGWSTWTFQSVWACIGLVTVVYLIRHLSLSILGSAYPITKEVTHFSFSIVLHNILLGIGLIPVNLFLAFGPEGMQKAIAVIGLAFCGLVYLMRQFRGLLISGSAISTNPFHFFVYLCAVEILPLFTLVKFFHN